MKTIRGTKRIKEKIFPKHRYMTGNNQNLYRKNGETFKLEILFGPRRKNFSLRTW